MIKVVQTSIAILFFILPVFSQNASSVVPTDVLFHKIKQHDFSISPDGKYFAEIINESYRSEIVILDIDEYSLLHKIPISFASVDNLYWLTSKRLLFESLGEIHAIDVDGENSVVIVKNSVDKVSKNWRSYYKNMRFNSIIHFLPEKKGHILIETYNIDFEATINEVNMFTGAKVVIVNGTNHKVNKWITDRDGVARLGLQFGEAGSKYLAHNKVTDTWEQFYVFIEGDKYPLEIDADSYLSQTINFEGFGYEKDIIYLTTNINSDKRKLVSYNIVESKVIETIAEDILCDISDPHGDDISLIFDNRERKLAGVRYQGMTPQHKWMKGHIGDIHNRITEKFPSYVNDIVDYDDSVERFVIHQWSDNRAGNIGIFDTKDDSYAVMFHFNEELNKYALSKARIVVATTRDDYKIPCYLNYPANYTANNGPIPLVVMPHGGPWARDYYSLNEFVQYFNAHGYATLRVNFRGSTGFGKEHVLAGVNSIDEIMINDIADATNFMLKNYDLDASKVFMFGHSYGGYATYMSLAKYPEIYAAGVALSAPTDIKEWMKKQKKSKNYFSYEFWTTVLGSNDSKYLSKISPISHAIEINNPLLIFHGKRDGIVPVEQAEDMMQALKKHKKNAKLEVLQNDDHSFSDSNSLEYILDKSDLFFKNSIFNKLKE